MPCGLAFLSLQAIHHSTRPDRIVWFFHLSSTDSPSVLESATPAEIQRQAAWPIFPASLVTWIRPIFTKISKGESKDPLVLSYLDLAGFDFNHAILENVVFKYTDLSRAIFINTDLRGVDFRTARFRNTLLVDCILKDTKLTAEQLKHISHHGSIDKASIFPSTEA